MKTPYSDLPPESFWRSGVADMHPLTVTGLYNKRFNITPDDRIATAGSCFAQHIANFLRKNGYSVLDVEPAPTGLSDEHAKEFGYGIYSARYGNIYLTRQLLQLAREAFKDEVPADIVWEKNGRFYDALRPNVEPNGLASPEEVIAHRHAHLAAVRSLFKEMSVFVFTFGLTEGWIDKVTGRVFPTCPGTIAGSFDPDVHAFKNFTVGEIRDDFAEFRKLILKHNPNVRFLCTVSPVPLTATASGDHVLSATSYSKAVLRAAAGELYSTFEDLDYFPSFEIIWSPWSRGFFYEANLRSVNPGGVEAVMRVFFQQHPPAGQSERAILKKRTKKVAKKNADDVVCEEQLLDAFADR